MSVHTSMCVHITSVCKRKTKLVNFHWCAIIRHPNCSEKTGPRQYYFDKCSWSSITFFVVTQAKRIPFGDHFFPCQKVLHKQELCFLVGKVCLQMIFLLVSTVLQSHQNELFHLGQCARVQSFFLFWISCKQLSFDDGNQINTNNHHIKGKRQFMVGQVKLFTCFVIVNTLTWP